jgi:very-short-patch-repair endonuclease
VDNVRALVTKSSTMSLRRDSAACVRGLALARMPRTVATRHIAEFDPAGVTDVSGAMVTTPDCTVLQCATFLGPREGLVVADSALRVQLTCRAELARRLAAMPSHTRGAEAAAFVVAESDGRAESAFESVSRYEFLAAGLPRPALQVWVNNRRLDFLWVEYRVIGEEDGLKKHGSNEVEVRNRIRAERERQRELEDLGYVFVRWLWDGSGTGRTLS